MKYCLLDVCGTVQTDEVDVISGKLIRINHCFVNFIGYGLYGFDSVDRDILRVSQILQTQLLAIKVCTSETILLLVEKIQI